MKFESINDKRVEDLSLTDLNIFLSENAFFKFMDSGRSGLQSGAEDAIDNFSAWIMSKGPFGRGKLRFKVPMAEYFLLRNRAQAALTDGLITSGSHGIRAAISKIYLMTLDAVIETQEETKEKHDKR